MSYTFRQLYMPYCLDRQKDGRYVVLNRLYKPVGMTVASGDYVTYADHPCLVTLKGLTAQMAARISCDASRDLGRIQLYDDGCMPEASDANWAEYTARLQLLLKLDTGIG